MLSCGAIFVQDIARPQIARRTATKLRKFKWKVLDHPLYNPDLVTSDYHLFLHMKTWFDSKHFDDDEELKTSAVCWLRPQAAEFYDCEISKLVRRYYRCLNEVGNLAYVEKYTRKCTF